MFLSKLNGVFVAVAALGIVTWAARGGVEVAAKVPGAPVPAGASERAMETLWADLGSADDATSTRAMLRLAAAPNDAVPFLAARLRAAGGKVDEKRLDELVKMLAAEKEEDQAKAADALVDLADNPVVRTKLKEFAEQTASADAVVLVARVLLKKTTGDLYPVSVKVGGTTITMPNARSVTVTVLENGGVSQRSSAGDNEANNLKQVIEVAADPNREATKDTRKGRAVVVLAHVGSPEAVKALEELAAADAKSPLTQAAKEALKSVAPGK